jgi:hypothetical protein
MYVLCSMPWCIVLLFSLGDGVTVTTTHSLTLIQDVFRLRRTSRHAVPSRFTMIADWITSIR